MASNSLVTWCSLTAISFGLLLGCTEGAITPPAEEAIGQTTQALSVNTIRVSLQADVAAPASAVWETVGNFNGWDKFLSVVEDSRMSGSGIGAIRFLKIRDTNKRVVERQDYNDKWNKIIAYTILDSGLPVDDYHSIMRVKPITSETSRVEWSSTFIPKNASRADAKQFITDFYTKGLSDLQKLFTPKYVTQKFIPVPPETVWSIVGDFNGLGQFVDSVAASHLVESGPNTFRILDFNDGVTTVIERLDNLDDDNLAVTYSIVSAPLPFENYTSTIKIDKQANGSLVTWSGRYNPVGDPSEAENFLRNLYTTGLDTLYSRLVP